GDPALNPDAGPQFGVGTQNALLPAMSTPRTGLAENRNTGGGSMNTRNSNSPRRRWYLGLGAAGLMCAVAIASLLSTQGPKSIWAAGSPSAPPPAVASANDLS